MFYVDVLVFPIYACRNWTRIKRYIFILVPRGREKIWPCKVGRDEKSLKSTDLTAAYDTFWHRGLTCKFLRLFPDKNMIRIIMELVRNRRFTFTTGDSNQSRLRCLRNGVP